MKIRLWVVFGFYIFLVLGLSINAFCNTYDESYASQGVVFYSHETISVPKGYNTFIIKNLPEGTKHVEWYFDDKY